MPGGRAAWTDPGEAQVPPVKLPADFWGNYELSNSTSVGDYKWFEIFQDPQLQKLIKTALENNTDLATAMARVEQGRANLGLARANQYPQVNLQSDIDREKASVNTPNFFNGLEKRTTTVGDLFFNLLSFEIDIWGRLRNKKKSAESLLQASEEDRRAVMTTVVSDVATDYFDLLEFDAELAIDTSTLATRQDSLRITKARAEGGLGTLLDVTQAQQLVEQAALAITDTQRQMLQMENSLNLLLGLMPGPVLRGQTLDQQFDIPSIPVGLPSSLLARRPDIRSAELNVESEHFLIKSARAALFPQITLTSLFGYQSSALANFFTGPSARSSVMPSISQPIFDGGRLRAGVEQEEGNLQVVLIKYKSTILTAFNDVSNALVQCAKIRESYEQQGRLVENLKLRSQLSHLRYDGGLGTFLDALDADRDLLTARLTLAQDRRNELLALVQLYKALGGGWQ